MMQVASGAGVTYRNVYFLLFTMATLAQAARSDDRVCKGDYCRVSPGNMEHLQEMLQSNRVVHFEKGDYHITPSGAGGFIQVQNVVNLTIIGHGVETQILCSPNAIFGFYFNNVSNLTISGLSISNCSAPVPETLVNELSHDLINSTDNNYYYCKVFTTTLVQEKANLSTPILIVDSCDIIVSNMIVRQSPGFGVIAIGTSSQDTPNDFLYQMSQSVQNLMMKYNELFLNKQGSLLLHRSVAELSHSFLNDNVVGILASESDITLRNVSLKRSSIILMQNSHTMLSGTLNIDNSPTFVLNSDLLFQDCDATFSNISGFNFTAALTIFRSYIDFYANSSVIFKNNNLSSNSSAMIAVSSFVLIQNNTTLIFINNTARDIATILGSLDSIIIIDGALLLFKENSATSAWIFLIGSLSSVRMYESQVVFQENVVKESGRIVEICNSNFRSLENTSVLMQKNLVKEESEAIFVLNGSINFEDHSKLILNHNIAQRSSVLLMAVGNLCAYVLTMPRFHSAITLLSKEVPLLPQHNLNRDQGQSVQKC